MTIHSIQLHILRAFKEEEGLKWESKGSSLVSLFQLFWITDRFWMVTVNMRFQVTPSVYFCPFNPTAAFKSRFHTIS